MQIGEFAQLVGTTPRMLRHYEATGLLLPASRSANGYRVYERAQLPRAQQIRSLLTAGLPVSLIRQLLDTLTDDGGVYPEHVDAATVTAVEAEFQRMCRCIDCMTARRDALGSYLASLRIP